MHFDVPSTSAALGGSPGPLGQHFEEEDPFIAPTHAQPSSNQVRAFYIIFTAIFDTFNIERFQLTPN